MTYRVKRLFLDSQEVKYFGTFQTEGEAKMRLAQVLEDAFDEQGIDSSEVRGQIEVAMKSTLIFMCASYSPSTMNQLVTLPCSRR